MKEDNIISYARSEEAKAIQKVLCQAGFDGNHKAYGCLKCALEKLFADEELILHIKSGLYPEISTKLSYPESEISTILSDAIQECCSSELGKQLREELGYSVTPNVGEFLCVLKTWADRLLPAIESNITSIF